MFNSTNEALKYIQGYKTLQRVKRAMAIRETELKFLKKKEQTLEIINRRMELAVKIQFCHEAMAEYEKRCF